YRQMLKLIQDGRIYVARPPLFKVTQKKSVRYVQTIEEMNHELMDRGLDATRLVVAERGARIEDRGKTFETAGLAKLVQVLSELEEPLLILERRGFNLASFLARAGAAGLPIYRVLLGGKEHWFVTSAEVDAFRKAEQEKLGRELV